MYIDYIEEIIMPKKIKSTSKKQAKKADKLDSLSQAHGKTEHTPQTLDQIWGDDGVSKYKTLDAEVYEKQLDNYNLTDLQRHASRFGIIPVESRARLKDTLMREFKKHASSYNVPNSPGQGAMGDLSEEAKKILKEGA